MKERDTVILSIRIPKELLPQINEKVAKSKYDTRNSWFIWAIRQGLRNHRR